MPTLTKSAPQLARKQEALAVDNVACADLHLVAVVVADPVDGAGLPLAEALGGVDAEHIRASLDERGHALGIVAGVDTRADNVALVLVEQLVGVLLVGIIVLAENDALQVAVLVDEGRELILLSQMMSLLQEAGDGGSPLTSLSPGS